MCCDVKSSSFWSHICPATAVRKLLLVLRLHLLFQNIFCIDFFLMLSSESRADGRQSSVLHIWGNLGCFQVQQRAACTEVHLRWPDVLNFVVLPSGKWHHWGFCHSFLGNMCSVSQAETAPGFAVCVENLYGSVVTQLFVRARVRNCPVTTPRVVPGVRNILLGVAPIWSISWHCIVLGLL